MRNALTNKTMSRIGKKPISIPEGVKIEIAGAKIAAKGPLGSLELDIHPRIKIKEENNQIIVIPIGNDKLAKSLHGLTRTLINNMIIGVNSGYKKQLELKGTGYRVALDGDKLNFNLGFSHPVIYDVPTNIKAEINKNIITISGIDKQLAGRVAAEIRRLKLPEPYKGKGIRYKDEEVRRKAGKTVKSAGASSQ